ncbi:L,D-transpeptidase [Methylomonas sp. AM2-LC]|uniref:L,D-transpeptidase family protein n=1 Tax=Methylomonas sp. AM2-LC TaxID=3153301 RepID=UPI0032657362
MLNKIFIFLLMCLGLIPSISIANPDVWLLVDTEKLSMEIKKGDKTVAVLNNIAIGRNGAGEKNHRGDDVTPLGNFRIGWINESSNFRKFYGLTYPNVEHADNALKKGKINLDTYESIARAQSSGQIPPQDTNLGGQIGIHGLGSANLSIHKSMNWTHGCIALTNDQIDQLSQWVEKGTLVTVK